MNDYSFRHALEKKADMTWSTEGFRPGLPNQISVATSTENEDAYLMSSDISGLCLVVIKYTSSCAEVHFIQFPIYTKQVGVCIILPVESFALCNL